MYVIVVKSSIELLTTGSGLWLFSEAIHVDTSHGTKGGDHWVHWLVEVDGDRASFITNIKFRDPQLREGKKLVVTEFRFTDPGINNGLGSDEERQRIIDGVKQLTEGPKGWPIECVSEFTMRGSRTVCLAVDTARLSLTSFRGLLSEEFSEYALDPAPYKWAYFDDWLNPRPQDERWSTDSDVLERLERNGDLHHVPREVDHWLMFESLGQAEQAAQEAERRGFQVESFSKNDDSTPNDNAPPWDLHLKHFTSVDINTIWNHTGVLESLAERFGGRYDGWGCVAVDRDPDAP